MFNFKNREAARKFSRKNANYRAVRTAEGRWAVIVLNRTYTGFKRS